MNHTAGKFGIGLLLAAMASIQLSTAQTFTIIDGNVTTCTGALLDSGGEGGEEKETDAGIGTTTTTATLVLGGNG